MAVEIVRERLRVPCEGESLDAELGYPAAGEPVTALLLLAPHPHMGGRMDNNVVRHLARRAAEDGCAVLRFDYRGVGESTLALPPGHSSYEHFEAMEREQRYEALLPDARAALAALAGAAGTGPPVVVGYSLGAILAGMLAAEAEGSRALPAVSRLVALCPPVARAELGPLRDLALPRLFLGGDGDFAFDVEAFLAAYATMPGPRGFLRLPGADHFFRGEEERVYRALAPFLHGAEPRDGEA
jgi:alpha/beta superfamily hydrolase